MRVLFLTCQPPHHMAPPRLGDEQIDCGPWFNDEQIAGRWISRTTAFGDYDVAALLASLPADQTPDVLVCHVDCGFCLRPRNLAAFPGPRVLLAADSHWGDRAVSSMARYALSEPFDRTILLYDRHHAPLYRAAGVRNLHWLPGLTFPHPDSRVAASRGQARAAHLALVGKTGYHFRRRRLFASLVSAGLPLAWRELPQRELIRFYGSSLIGLNVAMNGDLNLRVFETLAGGAMLLADRLAPAAGLDRLLAEGREKVSYDNAGHLVELARHYLARPEEAAAIGAAGHRWFAENFAEARRRSDFQELVFDGRERPEFALEPEPAARVSLAGAELDRALAAYDFVNERHRHQETVVARLGAGAPPEFSDWLATLPRLREAGRDEAADLVFAPLAPAGFGPLAQARDVFVPPTPAPNAVAGQAALAARHLESGDLQTALELAQGGLRRDPRSADALLVLAELAREAGNLPLCQKVLADARRLAPTAPEVVLLDWNLARGDWPRQPRRLLDSAWRAFERLELAGAEKLALAALQLSPDLASAHFLLGLLHARIGRSPEAADPAAPRRHLEERLKHLVRAHELAPENAEYAFQLGLASRSAGLVEQAALAHRRALALDPSLAAAALGLGEACLELGRWRDAAEAFETGLAQAPGHAILQGALSVAREQLALADQPFPRALFARTDARADLPAAHADSRWRDRVLAQPDCRALVALAGLDHLPSAERIRLLIEAAALAPATCPPIETRPGLPARRALMSHQPWFGLDLPRLVSDAAGRGQLVALIDAAPPAEPAPRAPAGVNPGNHLVFSIRGFRLYPLLRYRLALELRLPPAAFEAENPAHFAVFLRLCAEACALIDHAEAMLAYFKPDTVVIAQGHDLVDAILRHLAVRDGLRVLALENVLHRDRLLWDDVSGLAVNRNLAQNHLWRYADAVSDAAASRTVEIYLASLPGLKSAEHAAPVSSVPAPARAAAGEQTRTLLYLGQVGNDASLLFGLRRFDSQADVIADLAALAGREGHRLVVKLHPKENPRLPHPAHYYRGLTASWLETHAAFQDARRALGDRLTIDADNSLDTFALIRAADVCVTINSQAGLEAALLGKEVVLCGDSFYGRLGFTHEAEGAGSLATCVGRALDPRERRNHGPEARRFFHVFTELYCRPKSVETVLRLMAGPVAWPAPTADFSPTSRQDDLVYDVGMGHGDDTAHHLSLGLRVVAVEADPELCAQARVRFEKEIADGRLAILNLGVSERAGVSDFWICDGDRAWNSLDRAVASRNGSPHHRITLPCQTFGWFLAHFGVPRTLKIDIDGLEKFCAAALGALPDPPDYVSVNLGEIDEFLARLAALGYDTFKCVGQFGHSQHEPPDAGESGRWLSAEEVSADYRHHQAAGRRGEESPDRRGKSASPQIGIHARRRGVATRAPAPVAAPPPDIPAFLA